VVPRRRGVHGLLGLAALAVGAGVSALPAAGDHGGARAGVALRGVRQAGLPDRGDDLPGMASPSPKAVKPPGVHGPRSRPASLAQPPQDRPWRAATSLN